MSQKTALLSVFYKDGIVEFARALHELDWNIIASGGTAKAIKAAGIKVTDTAELVGGGSILGHRVVTISREIHAGLLARNIKEDIAELEAKDIPWIDMVCVDPYPLEPTINDSNSTLADVIENTDIGGPAMLRSGAKGGRIVIGDINDRKMVIDKLMMNGDLSLEERQLLAAKAEFICAKYSLLSANYLSDGSYDGILGQIMYDCKYGENPYQSASFFSTDSDNPLAVNKFTLVEGTNPSYVNITDIDRLLQTITHIAATFAKNNRSYKYYAVGVKHGNACGASFGNDPIEVLQRTLKGSLRSIFGGMIITNFPINREEAKVLKTYKAKKRLLDGVFAPKISTDAIKILKRSKGACKMLTNPNLANLTLDTDPIFRLVRGGFLKQTNYTNILDLNHPKISRIGRFRDYQIDNVLLAKAICDTSNSNTITLVNKKMLIGNGTGRMDRVGAADLALENADSAKHDTYGAVASSDSFFPFPDGVEVLLEAGIKVIQSISGSLNDDSILQAVRKKNATLVWIPVQYGRGFFGH